MEIEIKGLRVQIDGLFELTEGLDGSPEITKSTNSLKLGKAWLGKCLGAIGTVSPYPKDGTRHSEKDIEKTADTSELDEEGKVYYASNNKALVESILTDQDWKNYNHIEKIDWLRESIGRKITEGENMIESSPKRDHYNETPLIWYWFESKKQLMVARFWLGFELERIRKADESMDSQEPVS
jgi:hypothetical protein